MFYVVTSPEAERFEMSQKIEDQPWCCEFFRNADELKSKDSLADLSDALYDGYAKEAFEAFARLRGGGVEVVGLGRAPAGR